MMVSSQFEFGSEECESSWPYIDINVVTMISADFATAAVLISFGVVLGKISAKTYQTVSITLSPDFSYKVFLRVS